MTAKELRDYHVRPITLAFSIVEHRFPLKEVKNLTGIEIRKILPYASDEDMIEELHKQLKIKQNATTT